ncbi:Phosphinothricin N-acetyltransferase [Rhodopirellula maiorica SM1]|uniref:Phosphinothricin N-acetyltransferase n=1 Tax=Rhodopirellula maiorica SM1 TaxID=1265738 RepID=M5R9B0_9BACT|nr:GNAT family N-acetyltransferase [Rhodopirellula maiorica]EMI15960.1 Phosphinothricin N-acetyltransferase [Rhodopirellula maiorica SM1]
MPPSDFSIRIRHATENDASRVAEIYNHYVDVGGATFDTVHLSSEMVGQRIKQPRPDGWYVAASADYVLGWASARRYSDRFGYRFCCETAIYIAPDGQGRQIGNQLQQKIDQHCIDCNLHHAVARIIADNQRSLAFHYRHGYEMVGIQKEIGRMNDQWVDVAILQKIFRPDGN